jgi:hypothetical protein
VRLGLVLTAPTHCHFAHDVEFNNVALFINDLDSNGGRDSNHDRDGRPRPDHDRDGGRDNGHDWDSRSRENGWKGSWNRGRGWFGWGWC